MKGIQTKRQRESEIMSGVCNIRKIKWDRGRDEQGQERMKKEVRKQKLINMQKLLQWMHKERERQK